MKKVAFLLIVSLSFFLACDSDNDGPSDNYDRAAMLTHWVDGIIVPGMTAFAQEVDQLDVATKAFAENPSMESIMALQTQWEATYLLWQRVSMFTSPTTESLRYRDQMNIYPLNTDRLSGLVASGDWNLLLPSNMDVQGFPAMDYLLYGLHQNETDAVNFYASDDGRDYLQYLVDVSARMKDLTDDVLANWKGTFRDEFIANSGNSATASVDRFVNDYVYYYEKYLRSGKVGIPAGVFSGTPLANKVEAPYRADLNKALLLAALDATQDFFNGIPFNGGASGESMAQYLNYLNTMKDGADLTELINAQFDVARNQINTLGDDLGAIVESDNTQMLRSFDELQRNVVLLKVDMLQAMNINVDYIDADGD